MQRLRDRQITETPRLASLRYPAFVAALDAKKVASTRWVYLLSDPRDGEIHAGNFAPVRYVGCTLRVGIRYREHILEARKPKWNSNTRKVLFIQQLLCERVFPAITLFEEIGPGVNWSFREQFWIEEFYSPDLTNFDRLPEEQRPIPCTGQCAGVPVFPVDGKCPICGYPIQTLEERNAKLGQANSRPDSAGFFRRSS